jgi:polysaccharide pyruvyl transferase WcaK-like protein
MQKYKLIIKGGYGLTNFGDDALLYVLSSNLLPYFNKNDVAFACYKNNYNKLFINGFEIINVSEYKNTPTKVLIYGGGTQFYNFKKPPSLLRKYLSRIKQFLLFKKEGKILSNQNYDYIGALGIGVGPFENDYKQSKELLTKIKFKEMSFISIRDHSSFELCNKWHIDNFRLESDICYSLDNQYFFQKQKNKKIQKIGIIVRDWDHTKEGSAYYEKISTLYDKLKKENIEVTLILFATNSDNYWNNKKADFENVLEWIPEKMSMDFFIEKLNTFDLFITARYHGAIFSTLLGKPFISIVVEQKLSLISDIFINSSEKWIYPFDVSSRIDKIKIIDVNYSHYCEETIKEALKQKELSEIMFKRFINFCEEKKITKELS